MYRIRPVANGTRTDHPIPGLPFINDGRLPLDNPDAIERTGRNQGQGLWGRTDRKQSGVWVAFTTEPKNPAFAWAVYHHPLHGRTVLLIHDGDQGDLHSTWMYGREGFLHRRGGYWWDGEHWHRPGQVWDRAFERYDPRPVDNPTTITAADLLDATSDPERASTEKIASFTVPDRPIPNWTDHLALWAQLRASQPDALPLDSCIVDLQAPELERERLIDTARMAETAGISTDDLPDPKYGGRYELPEPQHQTDGRMWWSVPVAQDRAEHHRRENGPETLLSAATEYDTTQPAGFVADHNRLRKVFHDTLTEPRHRKGRQQSPYLNGELAQQAADALGWDGAINLMYGVNQGLIPHGPLRSVLIQAIVGSFAEDVERHRGTGRSQENPLSDVSPDTVKLLTWYIQRRPQETASILGEICIRARLNLNLTPAQVGWTLRSSFHLDSGLASHTVDTLLDLTLPPSATDHRKS
ncbi:hypothetical protein ACWDCB_35200 [Streptomyces sp. NPDC001178]